MHPVLTTHRLRRALTWARVWLAMALALIPARGGLGPFVGWMTPALEARVRAMRTLVLHILFALADQRAPRRLAKFGVGQGLAKNGHGHGVAKRGHARFVMRIAVGHRLTRRRRGVRAEIEALLALARDPEAAIARLVRRLTRGLIRRRTFARPVAAMLLAALCGATPSAANSS